MSADILIQNVSSQCIPNLVAVRTFRPRKVVWVYTDPFSDELARLRDLSRNDVQEQEAWRVDARDVEAMHRALADHFSQLKVRGHVMFHLTGGTKSMALQGLYNLGNFRRARGAEVSGVVMDPGSQHFDIIYPHAVNNAHPCARLALDEMLAVHGNQRDPCHASDTLEAISRHAGLWQRIRLIAPAMKKNFSLNDLKALHPRPTRGRHRHFESKRPPSRAFRQVLDLLQQHGYIENLHWQGNRHFQYDQQGSDVIQLLNGGWLECWLGAVLHQAGIHWHGAGASYKVIEHGGGSQEFDFLGATDRNRLVYWSCKTDTKLGNDKLFEVDALRDGIAGADFHVAGLLHTASVPPVMQAKARRMKLHLVHAYAPDAEEQLVRISGG